MCLQANTQPHISTYSSCDIYCCYTRTQRHKHMNDYDSWRHLTLLWMHTSWLFELYWKKKRYAGLGRAFRSFMLQTHCEKDNSLEKLYRAKAHVEAGGRHWPECIYAWHTSLACDLNVKWIWLPVWIWRMHFLTDSLTEENSGTKYWDYKLYFLSTTLSDLYTWFFLSSSSTYSGFLFLCRG